jgi:mannose-6-phosphate isomerase-like protein (cupin superfamily)
MSKKIEEYKQIKGELISKGYQFSYEDTGKPWGAYFAIDPEQTVKFISDYFAGTEIKLDNFETLSLQPKILIVNPRRRLSWQYHHRRSEVWRVVNGPVSITISDDDMETEAKVYKTGDVVTIKKGKRHRLVGLDCYGVVAEIWQHIDPDNPSDEDDIVRLQDDSGRQ